MTKYLIVQTGFEGIEKLGPITDSRTRAVKIKKKLQEEKISEVIKRRKYLNKWVLKEGHSEWQEPETLTPEEEQKERDFFCIQKWTGKEWVCACVELGVSPSQKMLR